MLLFASGEAPAASTYVDFDAHDTYETLSSANKSGVVVKKTSGGAVVRLAPGRSRGALTLKPRTTATRFDTLVPSWNASTPSGTWVRVQLRVRSGGKWTGWFDLGVWAKGTGTVKRHSTDGQRSGDWRVLTDTLQSAGPVFAGAYQYRITLHSKKEGRSPQVRALFTVASDSYRHGDPSGIPALRAAWGRDLDVPRRSQMVYPDGGEVWCSPTSLSMVMAYWAKRTGRGALNQSVPTVARGTYDYTYRGWGNWPFNTAYAGAYGLEAKVSRFSQIEQAERWIDMGIPVIASIAWNNRYSSTYLRGAPIPASDGHLLVIRGFTASGDVIVNDPAASSDSRVRRVYDRAQFSRAWLRTGSGGVVYLVHPKTWRTPYPYASRGSW